MNVTRRFASFLAVALFASATISLDAQTTRGSWTASLSETNSDQLQLNTTRRPSNNQGQTIRVSDFTNLSLAQIRSASQTPVNFELRREAGTLSFEGVFRNGDGAGHFTFTPSATYEATIRSLGLTIDKDDHDDDPLFAMAMFDVSSAFIREMRAAGYRESLDKYVAMRIFRVTPQLAEEFRQIGFDRLSADKLIAAQIHKVTPAYIREMRNAGFTKLDLDELVASRIHKITPEYARQMKAAGYGDMDHDDLMSFRIHKVTPEFITELRDLGYRTVDADDLVSMRIHKVTPEFVRELRTAGYADVPVDKLIAMRIHKVTPEFIREVRAAGYSNVPIEKLISMRIHNIDPKFISKMNGNR